MEEGEKCNIVGTQILGVMTHKQEGISQTQRRSSLRSKGFKQGVRMFSELGRRMEKHSENFNKKLENIRKNQ